MNNLIAICHKSGTFDALSIINVSQAQTDLTASFQFILAPSNIMNEWMKIQSPLRAFSYIIFYLMLFPKLVCCGFGFVLCFIISRFISRTLQSNARESNFDYILGMRHEYIHFSWTGYMLQSLLAVVWLSFQMKQCIALYNDTIIRSRSSGWSL